MQNDDFYKRHEKMSDSNKKAVVLLSGGLDSATVLTMAKAQGYECYCLSFFYGQKHTIELDKAGEVARFHKVKEHRIINIDLGSLGGSSLTDKTMQVPKGREHIGEVENDIPDTYVPVRNLVFLSYAMAWAEVLGAYNIFIGVNCSDYSGYPDCRPEFIEAFEKTANLASAKSVTQKGHFKIHAPIIHMSKAQIIREGVRLGMDYSLTHTCYDPAEDGRPCGKCDSCILRLKGFEEAGLKDPVEYADDNK